MKKRKIKLNTIRKIILVLAIVLLLISLIVLFLNKVSKIDLIFNTIFIGISINLLSSMLLIFLLDKRKQEEDEKELQEKNKIVTSNLIKIIKNFNDLIANMYKATITEEVKDDDKITEDLYYDIELLYSTINKILEYSENTSIIINNFFKGFAKEYINFDVPDEFCPNEENDMKLKGKMFFIQTGFKTILVETKKIIQYINRIEQKNYFKISKDFFNNTATAPLI